MKYLPESMSRVNCCVGRTLLIPLRLLWFGVDDDDAFGLVCETDTFYLIVVVAVGGILKIKFVTPFLFNLYP